MTSLQASQPIVLPVLAWLCVALAGVAAPAAAIVVLKYSATLTSLDPVGGPIFAVGLMGTGMIAAAAALRLWVGIILALLAGVGLIIFARALGLPPLAHPLSLAMAGVIAATSFAVRGALFARSAAGKGWCIAVAVVAGEAAVVLTALVSPGAWPDWLLALLPAQWASIAIQAALTGTGTLGASSALIALGGTAAATLLVVRLWPRRWPYLAMFAVWLSLSALVYQQTIQPIPNADLAEFSNSLKSSFTPSLRHNKPAQAASALGKQTAYR